MFHAKARAVTALVITCLSAPASAAEVHKWVDSAGVTHYSDEPPPTAEMQVIRIDVTASRGINPGDDYYSIANQWARMHRERIELVRIRLEQDRLKAEQQARAPRTEVVYVESPAAETRHVKLYKHKPRSHGHYGKHYRHGNPAGFVRQQQQHPQINRASLGYFKQLQ